MKANTKVRWFPFDHRQDCGFKDEAVSSCYLGKVFYFVESRNAGQRHYGHESCCFDLADAMRKIGDRRKKGSNWIIEELPVMVLAGDRDSLVVGEGGVKPLANLFRSRTRYIALEQAAEHCRAGTSRLLFRAFCMIAGRDLVPPAQLPFWEHRTMGSFPNGDLFWNRHVSVRDLASVQKLISRTNEWLQRQARLTSR